MDFGGGRFEVRGTLGTGGAGVVYRAFDRQLGREVALKHLRQASGRDLYRFKREFRALADIVHPSLVRLHELHASGDDWYFTMELVEGVSFIDWVRPGQASGPTRTRADIAAASPDEPRLRAALIELADALVALHEAGKLHRDLKPSNVLVTAAGRVALLDFGLVTAMTEARNPERLAVGTPVYMSPEQASDQPLGEASDWYALGAMLYEALVGRRPFEGESELVMTRKQTELPPSPLVLAPKTPRDLAALCMQLLQPSPAARPGGRTVLGQLGATPSPRTRDIATVSASPPFVGRARELEDLQRALSDARRRGAAVIVRGPSGIGKTALVRKFLRAAGDGVFVLEGRCFEREQVPFKMLDGIVDALTGVLVALPATELEAIAPRDLPALVRLFPVMKRVQRFAELAHGAATPADPTELRRRGFAALRALLARLARVQPIVVFVDDAHWGDADSIGFLAELVHQIDAPMLVVVAHRPEDYLGVVAKLKSPPSGTARRGDVRELELGPLGEEDAIQLVVQLAADSRHAERVVRAGAGHPLVLAEMARAPQLGDDVKIEDVVRARVQRLAGDAQALLAVSAVAARPIPLEVAAHAAGIVGGHDEANALAAERLATLRRVGAQLILSPAHDHVRAAVLAGLDVEARASWHEALARAFESASDGIGPGTAGAFDPQAVVEHWLAAGHPANAAHHAVAAGARAEDALAFRRAAELYEIALTYGPWDAAGQRDLLRKCAHALACAGQLDEAAQRLAHAAQLLPDDDALDCERLRIEALLRRGRLDEALPAAHRLLDQLGIKSPLGKSPSRTRLAAQWGPQRLRGLDYVERTATDVPAGELRAIDALYSIASGLAFADPSLGRVLQAELVRRALEAGEPVRVCLALVQELCYAAVAGSRNAPAVGAVGDRLDAIAGRIGHAHVRGLADTAIGIAAYMNGRWRDARGRLEAGIARLHDHGAGVRWELDVGESYWLGTLYQLGEWRELYRQSTSLLRDALERGDVVAQLGVRSGRGNLAWLIAGRVDEARAQLDAAERSLAPGFHLPHVHAIQAGCNVDLYAGDAAEAARKLERAWPELERLGILRIQLVRVELQLLRARVALADSTRSREDRGKLARGLAEEVIKEGAPWAIGIALAVRASAQALRGETAAAHATLAAAEEQLAAAEMQGMLQVVRLRRGQLEGGPGGAARAAAARDALADLGAREPDRVATLLVPWDA
ncbi:MAG TPA: serine/threonine-protein kinase [Kofleriaceae bacterium]|nr:serine/threonine-protein kinase [Kofleriaceae bacterium]